MDVDCSSYERSGYRNKRDNSDVDATTTIVPNLPSDEDGEDDEVDEDGKNIAVTNTPQEGIYITM